MIGRNRFYCMRIVRIKRRINLVRSRRWRRLQAEGLRPEESYPPVLSCAIHTWNEGKAIPFARNSYWRSRDDRCELRAVKACLWIEASLFLGGGEGRLTVARLKEIKIPRTTSLNIVRISRKNRWKNRWR